MRPEAAILPKRVAIDAHVLSGKPQGSATFLLNILREMAAMPSLGFELLIYCTNIEQTRQRVGESDFAYAELPRSGSAKRLLVHLPRLMKRDRVDLGVFQFIAPPLDSTPSLIVMHDILPITHPHIFPPIFRWSRQWLFANALRRARGIVTISEFTRSEIARVFPAQTVTPVLVRNGPSFAIAEAKQALVSGGIDGPYVLAVGRIEKRKNIDLLIDAFLACGLDHVKLVIVGAQDMGYDWRAPQSDQILHLQNLSNADLQALYRGASLFVFPSEAEGFGIPLLDALLFGIPTIASDQTAMKEVASGYAVLFDPTRPDAKTVLADHIAGHFSTVPIAPPTPLQRLDLSKTFNWSQSAQDFVATIRQALGTPA